VTWFPEQPEVPAEQRVRGQSSLSYEDVSQDGRLMLLALPQAIGHVIWQKLMAPHPLTRAAQSTGIVPLLTRYVIEGGEGPVSVRALLEVSGRYQLAHTVGPDGEVARLVLAMWADVSAPIGRTYGPPPPRAGELVRVGRVFAEHVLTRPFAPQGARKVVRLEVEGIPPVPPDRLEWRPPEAVLELPPGGRALDEEPVLDSARVVFGLGHTDSNQHVNSLVYPRLFQDAALRRLAAHGRPTDLLATRLEVAYRKPSFAGGRAAIALRAFEVGERSGAATGTGRTVGATGAFVEEGSPAGRPLCTVQMTFG